MLVRVIWVLSCAFVGSFLLASPVQAKADIVFRNGVIYTVDETRSWASAVAIENGKFVYVGSSAGVESHIGKSTSIVDLGGKMVLPGIHDPHVHVVTGGLSLTKCPLYDAPSQREMLDTIAVCAGHNKETTWLIGQGWWMDAFSGISMPTKELLDSVVPDRPAVFMSGDLHTLWVNSKALEIAGITRETPDPDNGRIDRDPQTGEPSGTLQEDPAFDLVLKHVDRFTDQDLTAGLRHGQIHLNSFGVTAIQDAKIRLVGNNDYRSLNAYQALDKAGGLTLRTIGNLFWETSIDADEQIETMKAARSKQAGANFKATTVKIWVDGIIETETAALMEPYVNRPEFRGRLKMTANDLTDIVTKLDREKFQIHIHAIGDRAIKASLIAYAAARETNGVRDSRHHISHIQLIDPVDIPRFRELDVVANFQPLWAYADTWIEKLTVPRLGRERLRWMYPIGSIVRDGAIVAFSSDWSVSSANPFEGMEVAITRMSPYNARTKVFNAEERIVLHDAIASYTINGAFVNFLDDKTGSIEVGKLADMIVIDRNLFEIPASDISNTAVLLTLLEGVPVHGRLDDVQTASVD